MQFRDAGSHRKLAGSFDKGARHRQCSCGQNGENPDWAEGDLNLVFTDQELIKPVFGIISS